METPDRNQLPKDPIDVTLTMAIAHHEMFNAYIEAGFTRHEAFELTKVNICAFIAANLTPNEGDAHEND
jgi:hypothetical protein